MSEEVKKSCCCSNTATKDKEQHSCCHSTQLEGKEQQSKAQHSCCDKTTTKDKEQHSCCHSTQLEGKEHTQPKELHSCCDKTTMKDKEQHSCCHSTELEGKEHTPPKAQHSCCDTTKGGTASCCGVVKKGDSKVKTIVMLSVSLVSLIISFIAPFRHHSVMRYLDFGWIAVVLCGIPIAISGVKALAKGKVTSSLLITVSMLACIALEVLSLTGVLGDGHGHSNIFAAGEVAWLMAIGGLIEDFTVGKARAGIERLVKLAPTTARVKVDGQLKDVAVTDLKIGDVVTILPNDMISVDGTIVSGYTAADESIMTGESVPVDKVEGDSVFGGTWNKSGAIEVKVTKASDDMAVNKLKKLVEEAEGKKAPISKLADKWAGYIVPAAMVLSVIVFLVAFFALKVGVSASIERGVTMLVVFCPCAFALATPTAIAAGLGNSTRRGILIKSGATLEALASIKTVAFDKTGTLTTGELSVTDIFAVDGDTTRLKANVGALESFSEHPIAKAMVKACKSDKDFPIVTDVKSLVGAGVEGKIGGDKISIIKWSEIEKILGDSEKNLKQNAQNFDRANELIKSGKTVIGVMESGKLTGIIAVSDTVKASAAEAVSDLKAMGVEAVMLTGDNGESAREVGREVGISNVYHSLMPSDKLDAIEKLKLNGKVLMAGDGVNDAPALAAADCSIALAALGSDVAIETADAALMGNDIRKLPSLLKLARSVLFTIKGNIILSLTISFIAVILSTLGFLNPITGALVHNISSVLVVTNSAFILRRKEKASIRETDKATTQEATQAQ